MENKVIAERINDYYERNRQKGVWSYFDRIGFLNVGYWKGIDDDSIECAQINLMETLARFFYNTDGNVLDVACGNGAGSKFLTKYFEPKKITGINIAERQLELCKLIAPECQFKSMDATRMDFESSSFDNMLCIEAAVHFTTRQRFFEEAYRVLRPGGRLAMLDVLYDYDRLYEFISDGASIAPKDNYLPDLDAYAESLRKVGFTYVRIDDCTAFTGNAACAHVVRMQEQDFGRTGDPKILENIRRTRLHYRASTHWGMVYAIK